MINIRMGLFETNSSSTHSLVVMTKKQYNEWNNGGIFFKIQDEKFHKPEDIKFISKDDMIKIWKEMQYSEKDKNRQPTDHELYEWARWAGYVSSEDWSDDITGELDDYIVMSFYLSE